MAIWSPVENAEHSTQQEHGNTEDPYAVAVMNDGGMCLGSYPKLAGFLLEKMCKITGRRQRSALLQGGMEIPCVPLCLHLQGEEETCGQLKSLMKKKDIEPLKQKNIGHHQNQKLVLRVVN